MNKKIPVVAFERDYTVRYDSITEAAKAYEVGKQIIVNRIEDGATLKDGYTTLDYLYTLDDFFENRPN